MIDNDGVARLCDFGQLRLDAGPAGMTTISPFTGTLRYMAPELADSNPDTVSSYEGDVYSLGCVALEVRAYLSVWDTVLISPSVYDLPTTIFYL